MKLIIYIFSVFIICHNGLYLVNLFQQQYYSLTRLFILKKNTIKNYITIKLPLFYLLAIFVFLYQNKTLGVIILYLSQCLLLTKIKLNEYHFTRRFNMLLAILIIISLIMFTNLYFLLSDFIGVFLIFICNYLAFLLANFIMLPIEKIIAKHYITKAKNKVDKNNYIVIGITGSYGKTSMKNILYSILKSKYKISSQNHNYNTVLGLAKYINDELEDDDDILIVELGVDEVNAMVKFKKLFLLDFAIITSIGNMHLATFKNLDNIVKEKMNIAKLLKDNGVLFINKDDCNYKSDYKKVIYTSRNDICYYDGIPYSLSLYDKRIDTEFVLEYQLSYLSLALKMSEMFSLKKEEILFVLKRIIIPDRRFNISHKGRDIIIDNSYNSNELGFKLGIDLISKFKRYKVVITGGLFELGKEYEKVNRDIGSYLKEIDLIILVSQDLNHPLKNGFVSSSDNKLIQVDDYAKVGRIVDAISDEKVILYTAIGSNATLK